MGEGNEQYLYLRDPLGLTPGEVFVPAHLAPVLALFDGEHNLPTIRAALTLYRGMTLTPEELEGLVRELDEAMVLEGPRLEAAQRDALTAYRTAPFRQPALAGAAYPGDPTGLENALDGYCAATSVAMGSAGVSSGPVAGLLSPHIDYTRGNRVYAASWQAIAPALEDVEQVIIFGTDHSGGGGKVTLTRQSYATPWGVLPADKELTGALLTTLGEAALEEELHHAKEHSIELAAVWLHYMLRKVKGKASFRNLPTVVPILCGNMFPYVRGDEDPGQDGGFARLLDVLTTAAAKKRTLVVAAGDLAHVGPAFGDSVGWDMAARATLKKSDESSLEAVCQGDAPGFFQGLKQENDARRVCGLTPIYLALRLLGSGLTGQRTGYEQCPADPAGASLVSIAGVVWRKNGGAPARQ
ncbi:MAG: AmmeMemoRadiSam system protein B [Chloroflexi bacterium]|nr:AmmeMemoRadiSam system protein B [Chloroflexota bacterium]